MEVMRRHRSPGDWIADFIIVTVMILLSLICVYPILFTLFASFSDAKALLNRTGLLFAPLQPYTLEGYRLAFSNVKLANSIWNTLIYVIGGTSDDSQGNPDQQ